MLDVCADILEENRVVSVPTVQREVAEVPSTLTVTPPAEPPMVFSHNGPPMPPEPPREPDPKGMTADEVCRRLGCAGEYIAQLRKHGIIKRSDRNGRMGCTMFSRESVEAVRFTWNERLSVALREVEASKRRGAVVDPHAPATEPTQTAGTMSAIDVAELLGCSRAYVTLMLQNGVITGTKIATKTGGYWRIDKASVDAVREGDAWRGLLKTAMERAKVERNERLAGRVPVVESAPAPTLVPAIPGPVVTASLPPVDEPDHNGQQSVVAETSDPVANDIDMLLAERKAKRSPVHRQKATNDCDPVEPFPEGPTVTALALVMRWGLTMRQLRAIVAEGWVRANADGEVLESDALWFENGTGPGSLKTWKRDNVGKGYGSTATSSLGGQEIG